LAAFALGTAELHDSSTIADHVDHCAACAALVSDLESSPDPLVEDLQAPAADDRFTSESECRQALAAIAVLGRDPSAAPTSGPRPDDGAILPVRIRDYQLLRILGAGGMGTVYQALHLQLEKIVAIKLLPRERTGDPQAISRFKREMKAVGRLDDPRIVRAFDAGVDGETHFLVTEYVPGIDVSTLAARLGPLPVAEACEIIRQAALALQHVSEHGLVHRDIKPSNLMLSFSESDPSADRVAADSGTAIAQPPVVKLLDLGLALLQESQPGGSELTGTGDVMGTADYIAPEQAESSRAVDIRADLYSLGCTLYRLLAGQAPFAGPEFNTPVKKSMAHLRRPVPPIVDRRPDLPAALVALIDRLVAKSPADRPASPAEVAAALEPFAAGADLGELAARASRQLPAHGAGESSMVSTDVHLTSHDSQTELTRKADMPPATAEQPHGVAHNGVAHNGIAQKGIAQSEVVPGSRSRPASVRRLQWTGLVACAAAVALSGLWSVSGKRADRSPGAVVSALKDAPASGEPASVPAQPSDRKAPTAPTPAAAPPEKPSPQAIAPTTPPPAVEVATNPADDAGRDEPAPAAATAAQPATASPEVYPTAVFPFDERGGGLGGYGAKISDFLNASLAAKPELYVVDRADLRKILDEQEINLSGLAKPEERVKVGQLTGARLLISGSVTELDKTLLLTARITGTENGRLVGVVVKGKTSDDFAGLVQKLADEVEATIHKRSGELVVKRVSAKDRLTLLKQKLAGKTLPKVWIHVTEGHIGRPDEIVAEADITTVIVRGHSVRARRTIDPAAETEIALLCKSAGFTIIDAKGGNRKDADVIIEGEAFSEFAGRHGNLISVKARVEITAVDRQSGERLASDRQTEIVVDLAEQIAGKTALQNAAAEIAERMLPTIAREPK
jgi:serine/threonine protein kinase/TolB-like protein